MSSNEPADVDLDGSPEALKLVLDTALDAVIVMRGDGVVADWNDRAVRVFGWTREEAAATSWPSSSFPSAIVSRTGPRLRAISKLDGQR
jgi:PAS domain-containing protein